MKGEGLIAYRSVSSMFTVLPKYAYVGEDL